MLDANAQSALLGYALSSDLCTDAWQLPLPCNGTRVVLGSENRDRPSARPKLRACDRRSHRAIPAPHGTGAAELKDALRARIKAGRARGALWVRVLDLVRHMPTAEGRALLWTRVAHAREVHQTTPYTCEERYPDLFDLAAALAPNATRILSFGCSTGEELDALRRRFPKAEIVGAEINPRSRGIAARRVARDPSTTVVPPDAVQGSFDAIFALAVFQKEPHKIAEMGVEDLSAHYPFERFDAAVRVLAGALRPGGFFCVSNAHYRFEDSTVAAQFEPVSTSPLIDRAVYAPNGRLIDSPVAYTMFRKRSPGESAADHGVI